MQETRRSLFFNLANEVFHGHPIFEIRSQVIYWLRQAVGGGSTSSNDEVMDGNAFHISGPVLRTPKAKVDSPHKGAVMRGFYFLRFYSEQA